MIKPKPEIGKPIIFIAKMKISPNHDHLITLQGTVLRKIKPDWYKVEIEDDWNNHREEFDIHISHVHSFEWGGVMTLNPRRNKKVFDSLGWI